MTSGAAIPDVGRVSVPVRVPLVVDADTGYGNAISVQRTVRALERVEANAIQFEDQTSPKRCGSIAKSRSRLGVPPSTLARK